VQTLQYLDRVGFTRPVAVVDGAWGDVYRAQEAWPEAVTAYDAALASASRSVRSASLAPSLQFRRGIALEQAGDLVSALAAYRVSVPLGGADDPAVGWLRLASVGARTGGDDALYTEVLTACDKASEADPENVRGRAITWYRALALEALQRDAEAAPLFADLAAEPDAWGLKAREHTAAVGFDQSFDTILAAASEG
jgi:tetratricopeptide (TPR) repeat protein